MKNDDLDWFTFPTTKKNNCLYSVCEDGTIISTTKINYVERKITPYNNDGRACVKINEKECCVKNLVALAFIEGYKKGMNVVLQDKNMWNCSLDNLIVVTKQNLGKATGFLSKRNRKVVAINKITNQQIAYLSIRQCAKAMFCSYQTILDYMNGIVKDSILSNYNIIPIQEQEAT